jgi:NADPH-dependent curcumin reductase CurA
MTDAIQIVLVKRPAGDVTPDCFREEKVTLPALADGQVLVRSASCRSTPTCARA